MLPMICDAIFLVSVDLSLSARCSTGMMRAREGASMKCTKEVWSRTCRHGAVLEDGSMSASSSTGEIAAEKRRKRRRGAALPINKHEQGTGPQSNHIHNDSKNGGCDITGRRLALRALDKTLTMRSNSIRRETTRPFRMPCSSAGNVISPGKRQGKSGPIFWSEN